MTDSTDPAQGEEGSTVGPASNQGDDESDDPDDSDRSPRSEHADQEHLQGVEDGCGCTEVWEHLSDQRERNRAEREESPEEDVAPATGED
jgi:hypothetical protein